MRRGSSCSGAAGIPRFLPSVFDLSPVKYLVGGACRLGQRPLTFKHKKQHSVLLLIGMWRGRYQINKFTTTFRLFGRFLRHLWPQRAKVAAAEAGQRSLTDIMCRERERLVCQNGITLHPSNARALIFSFCFHSFFVRLLRITFNLLRLEWSFTSRGFNRSRQMSR